MTRFLFGYSRSIRPVTARAVQDYMTTPSPIAHDMSKLALIGHSHSVAFLDAISTNWRPLINMDQSLWDGYTRTFAGWFSRHLDGSAFELSAKPEFAEFTGMKTILFSPLDPSTLVQVHAVDGGAAWQLSPSMQRCIDALNDETTIISILYGAELCAVLIDEMPAYDFPPYDPGGHRPIDFKYISGALQKMAMTVVLPLQLIKMMRPAVRIIHVAPPPPLEDPATVGHLESFAAMVEKFGCTRPTLRLKWHYAYRDELRRQLMPSGILVVNEPDEAVSSQGFLRPEYAESLNHANQAYGALVAAQIHAILFG